MALRAWGTEGVAWLATRLSAVHEALGSVPHTVHKPGVVVTTVFPALEVSLGTNLRLR